MKRIAGIILFALLLGCTNLIAQTEKPFQLSTHILDINRGAPASGVQITLFKQNPQTDEFKEVGSTNTDENGRVENFLPSAANNEGVYKLKFETYSYFSKQNTESIYPYIEVVFKIEGKGHYHIPITVSANGYSTYRGN